MVLCILYCSTIFCEACGVSTTVREVSSPLRFNNGCWQRLWCARRTHRTARCSVGIQTCFPIHDEYAVHRSSGEDNIPGAVVGENAYRSEIFPALYVKHFILLKIESSAQNWQRWEAL